MSRSAPGVRGVEADAEVRAVAGRLAVALDDLGLVGDVGGGDGHARGVADPLEQARVDGRPLGRPVARVHLEGGAGGDDGVGAVVGGARQGVGGAAHRVGDRERAAHHGDAEHDGQRRQRGAQPAAGEALEGDPDHRTRRLAHRGDDLVLGRRGEVADDPAVGQEQHAVGGRGGARVVRDHHGRLAVDARRRRAAARAPRCRRRSRGCRSARRRTARSAGRSARGRSRRAAAGRRTARPACGRGARSGRRASSSASTSAADGLTRAIASGSVTFSSAVSVGSRLNDWKTKPMCLRRSFVSRRSAIAEISSPPTRTAPDVGRSRPASRCISVDLPEPDGPMTAVNWPAGTSSETPRSASTADSPSP